MIKIEDLRKTYKSIAGLENDVLKGINLRISKGKVTAILGPSGCGKTTLLNIISTMDNPTSGNVYIDGKKIDFLDETKNEWYRVNYFGYIFQFFHLFKHMTVFGNLDFVMSFKEHNQELRRKKIIDMLDKFNIGKLIDKYPSQLSGGEKQRVAIIRALINDAQIIIADEPTGALDSSNSELVFETLEELSTKYNKTVIIVTHDNRVLNYADEVFYMKDGLIEDHQKIKEKKTTDNKVINPAKNGMSLIDIVKYAINNLKVRSGRYVVMLIALMISITGLSLGWGIGNSSENQIINSLKNTTSASVINVGIREDSNSTNVKDVLKDVKSTNNIVETFLIYDYVSILKFNDINSPAYPIISILPKQYTPYESFLIDGRYPNDGTNEVLMADNYLSMLDLNIEDVLNKEIEIILDDDNNKKVSIKVVGILSKEELQKDLNDANKLIGGIFMPIDEYSKVVTNDYDKTTIKAVIKDLKKFESTLNSLEKSGYSTTSMYDTIKVVLDSYRSTAKMIVLLLSITMFVSILLMGILSYINTLERQYEVGVMKAIGIKKSNLNLLFVMEFLIILLISIFLGTGLAYLGQYLINYLFVKEGYSIISIGIDQILILSIIVSIITFVVSFYPIGKLSKKKPVEIFYKE